MIDIDVQKRLGSFKLDARVSTAANGVVALFGRSGSGKTTLINLLSGLAEPDTGKIVIGGETLFDSIRGINVTPDKRRLGYVFQEDRLFPHMSVAANLRYGMPQQRQTKLFDRVCRILDIAQLLERRPTNLSGGEKQRVSIGRALLAEPRLLLMDEPLASLDAARKDEILPFIEEMSSELGIPIFYVSHAMEEVIRLADIMVLMSDGRIVATGPVEELTSRLDLRPMTGRYEAGSVLSVRVNAHERASGFTLLDFEGGTFRVPTIPAPIGEVLRIRVRARDVSIATEFPNNISINNIFPAIVTEISDEPGPQLDVLMDAGVPLWARISKSSVNRLGLRVGSDVFAMVKSVAIDRSSLGRIQRAKRQDD